LFKLAILFIPLSVYLFFFNIYNKIIIQKKIYDEDKRMKKRETENEIYIGLSAIWTRRAGLRFGVGVADIRPNRTPRLVTLAGRCTAD